MNVIFYFWAQAIKWQENHTREEENIMLLITEVFTIG